MKSVRLTWAIPMLMFVWSVATVSAQTPEPFKLFISGPEMATVGQPVRIRVLLQNNSDHAIGVTVPNAILIDGSVLSIKGPSGQELPWKEGAWGFSGSMMSIKPGEVWDDVLRVDSFYDLSQTGRYTLQLKRPIAEDRSRPDYFKDGFVSSNIITLTVSPETVKPSASITLSLTGPQTLVSGSDVFMNALVKNVSGQDFFVVTDPDGMVDDRYYRLETAVGPNNAQFSRNFAHAGQRTIRTVLPGAALEVRLGKDAMGFDAEWIAYRAYRFQLIYSGPEPEQDPVASNVVTMNVTPAPAGGPTPFTLTLSGPETVTTGGAVRVDLAEKNTSNLGSLGPQDQLNLLECHFSVRDLSGHELPMNSQTDGITGSHHLKALESGWTSNGYAILSDFYDMSQPGTYRVQVSERSPGYPEAGPVFSNVITIQVRAAAR